MKKIEEIDKNLKVTSTLEEKDIVFFNVCQSPFKVYGITHDGTQFRRIPKDVAKNTNDGVLGLSTNTAGGRVRFKTDSPYVAISAKMPWITKFSHMALCGTSGFDMYLYQDGHYKFENTFFPPVDMTDGYDSIHYFPTDGIHEIIINFPLYNDVSELYIGIKDGYSVFEGAEYSTDKNVVYYGSSITQGGCASRPGNCYQAIISQKLDCDYINLGFSGSARAENAIVEYISSLNMSCFVFDYDHNAPDPEYLEKTHEPMFKAIRAAQPNLPVVFVSAPPLPWSKEVAEKRRDIVYQTYKNAVDNGDKNVYFVNGLDFYNTCGDHGFVDSCHPTDLGFWFMAETLTPIIKKILDL